jgi:hypothetical protein
MMIMKASLKNLMLVSSLAVGSFYMSASYAVTYPARAASVKTALN